MLSMLAEFIIKKNELLETVEKLVEKAVDKAQVLIPDLEYHILEKDGFTVVLMSQLRSTPNLETKSTTLSAVMADVFRSFPMINWNFDSCHVYVSYDEAQDLYELLTK